MRIGGATPRRLLLFGLAVLFLGHNDWWLWDEPTLVLGLPVGLIYHVGYCLVTAAWLALLVRYAWPSGLASGASGRGSSDRGATGTGAA